MPPSKQVRLALASFMDSPEASALELPDADVRTIASRFLGACYDDLGVEPRRMDGHDIQAMLGRVLPGHFARKDPLAEHVPAVLRAYLGHLETSQVVASAFELKRGFEEAIDGFLEAVRQGADARVRQSAQEPFAHRAEKIGRNDPCFCGSGRKFKKCHGKNA